MSQRGSWRTHRGSSLRPEHKGQKVTLTGWIHRIRDLGKLLLIDLRDSGGLVQLNFSDFVSHDSPSENGAQQGSSPLGGASRESVIKVTGVVAHRPSDAQNSGLATGAVEVMVRDCEVINKVSGGDLPFLFDNEKVQTSEALRLKYRYLELRHGDFQKILSRRSEINSQLRAFCRQRELIEVETPILYKPTPEGARDFLVPSRLHPRSVYALPQSPQMLKQFLMMAGVEGYFQIVRCFRDEDLRSDRQPEFTQLDIEASFVGADYFFQLCQDICQQIWSMPSLQLCEVKYADAIEHFGSDKPDLRYGLPLVPLKDLFVDSAVPPLASAAGKASEFTETREIIQEGGIYGLYLSGAVAQLSRKQLDGWVSWVRERSGQGGGVPSSLYYFKVKAGELSGGIAKHVTAEMYQSLRERAGKVHSKVRSWVSHASAPSLFTDDGVGCDGSEPVSESKGLALEEGVWFVICSEERSAASGVGGAFRSALADSVLREQIQGLWSFLWVDDFPLLEWNSDIKRWQATHHPFTAVHPSDHEKFLSLRHDHIDHHLAQSLRGSGYDLVCNGYELAGGSVRIHCAEEQRHMLSLLGMSSSQIEEQFGFFIEALGYGTPPHGGIAFGLDRLMMLLLGRENIRDVIAFPKTTSGSCLMSRAPHLGDEEQLAEFGLHWQGDVKKV